MTAGHTTARALRVLAALVGVLAVLAPASAAADDRVRPGEVRARMATPPALVFGIHPGGGVGTVNGPVTARPENPSLRQAALDALRVDANRPFVIHLYDEYRRRSDGDVLPAWLRRQIEGYADRGYDVELVLRYRPRSSRGDVRGFVRFVHRRVAQLADVRDLTHLQITNEANVDGAPDAADGAYRNVRAALVRGVIAADREARRQGRRDLAIGFNWAYAKGRKQDRFFRSLRTRGGRRFAKAVDWVGVNAYPGTWGPTLPAGGLERAASRATVDAMRALRKRHLPRARLGHAAIIFAESGYPTDLDARDQSQQQTVMTAVVRAVLRYRRAYRVHGLRWFKLRDANSSIANFESHYGLLRDDYSPKLGFFTYRELVDRYG